MKEVLHENDSGRVVAVDGTAIDVLWWTSDEPVEPDHTPNCVWCDAPLPATKPRLCFQLSFDKTHDSTVMESHLCFKHSFSLVNTLQSHNPSDGETKFTADNSSLAWGYYKQTSTYASPLPCLWCSETIDPSSALYELFGYGGASIFIHRDCCSPMCTKLLEEMDKTVDKHADDLFPHVF